MRVPYGEGLASHTGPESCGGDREVAVEALTGVRAGWVLSLENVYVRGADGLRPPQGNTGRFATARTGRAPRGLRPHARTQAPHEEENASCCGSREIPLPTGATGGPGPRREPERGTTAMHGGGKSDGPIVPAKPPNNAGGAPPAAEGVEGRGPAEGSPVEVPRHRTQCRIEPPSVRRRARRAVM